MQNYYTHTKKKKKKKKKRHFLHASLATLEEGGLEVKALGRMADVFITLCTLTHSLFV